MDTIQKQDLPFILTDLFQGDMSLQDVEGFSQIDVKDIIEAVQFIAQNPNLSNTYRNELLVNSWRAFYRMKPPTIEEFLSKEWIGPTADSLYPNVKEILENYWQPNSQKRHLVLGSAIGTGKSFTSTISSLYVTTHLWMMKNPKQFFGLSQATSIVHALISFSMEKAGQLLLQPFMQILLSTPKFRRVKQEEHLLRKQKEYPEEICWTTAGRMGALQFFNDIHYMLASSPQKLLGLNMITATMSELSFFLDQGFSPEYIWRIYNDAKGRVKNRFGDRYFSGTIMDSSPNDMEESPIDKYIFSGEAEKDKRNMVITGTHWDVLYFKDTYRDWKNSAAEKLGKKREECTIEDLKNFGNTFPVFRGSSSETPRILFEEERGNYLPDEIYNVPIDLEQNFIDDCLKSVKDYCGWPAGSAGKLFSTWDPIEDMFVPNLKNIYDSIKAPDTKPSKRLIWDTIHKRFWIKLDSNKYEFWRAPTAIRYLHIDQAETGDMAGISMVHPETTKEGLLVYITDFTLAISAGKGRINLEAIRFFITDMMALGGIRIGKVTFDQYQSSSTIQYLKEKNINAGRLSVDGDINAYLSYITLLNTRSIKSGRNIFLKNNIKSLQEVQTPKSKKKKIDHKKGKPVFADGGNWETSMMGINAKDLSDSHCGAVYNALNEFKGVPTTLWRPEEEMDSLKVLSSNLKSSLKNKYGVSF